MTSQPPTGTPDDSDTAEHGLGLYDAIVNGQHDDVLDQIELAAKARYRLDWRGVPRRLPTGIESAAVQVQIREGYYSPPQGILDDSMRLILEAVHNRRATLQNADMHPVKLTLTTEAFRGLHQRDTVGARAEDGREFTLDPQQFTDEELEALAEGDTLRKRDGATVLAIVVEGYQHERTVFEDVYGALVSSGQVWGLERQEGRSAILLVNGGERYLVTVQEVRTPALVDPETSRVNRSEERDREIDPGQPRNSVATPATSLTPSMEAGQVLAICGYGGRVVTADGQLAEADQEQPIAVLAEVGSVFFLYGHGYYLVELDTDLEVGEDFPPSLTVLSRVD